MNVPVRSRRHIVHLGVQVLLLAAAAVNVFLAAVVVSAAWWLALVFLAAAAAIVFGLWIQKVWWLLGAALASIIASAVAIRLDSPVDPGQPVITAVISTVLIAVWWFTRPRYVRHYPRG